MRLIEGKVNRTDTIQIDSKGRVFVTVYGIREYIEGYMEIKGVGMRSIENALKNISMTEEGKMIDHIRWIELDCEAILQYAENKGIKAEILRGIVKKQKSN